jgi:hypothetical protein
MLRRCHPRLNLRRCRGDFITTRTCVFQSEWVATPFRLEDTGRRPTKGIPASLMGELCWIKAYIARGIVESHGLCEGEREGYTNVLVGGGGEGEGGCLLIRWLLTSCACAACGKKREVWRWERWWVGRMTRRKIRQTGSLGKETDVVTVNLPRHTQSM